MTFSLRPLAAAVFALALAPTSVSAQSMPDDEGTDHGVVSTCTLYYENIPVDCSHLDATRVEAAAAVETAMLPAPNADFHAEGFAARIPPSELPQTQLSADPMPGSAFGPSDLTGIRSGAEEPRSSLYVEPFDPARTYTRR